MSRFRTKLSQLGTARGDKDKSQIAKMAQPMISKSFKVHGHAHQSRCTAFYEAQDLSSDTTGGCKSPRRGTRHFSRRFCCNPQELQ